MSHYYQKMNPGETNQMRAHKQAMIQPPHFIKVKSKTNNPTRKNSPGVGQRQGGQSSLNNQHQAGSTGLMAGSRGVRESNNSNIHTQMKRELDGVSSTGNNQITESLPFSAMFCHGQH